MLCKLYAQISNKLPTKNYCTVAKRTMTKICIHLLVSICMHIYMYMYVYKQGRVQRMLCKFPVLYFLLISNINVPPSLRVLTIYFRISICIGVHIILQPKRITHNNAYVNMRHAYNLRSQQQRIALHFSNPLLFALFESVANCRWPIAACHCLRRCFS